MARITYINEHDWMAVRATFSDGGKANVTWGRSGDKVVLEPADSKRAETLSLIVAQAKALTADPKTGYLNLGQLAETMKAVGERAPTLDAYLTGLKAALKVSGERPIPKAAAIAPASTQASMKKSRGGWLIAALFPSGERIEFKVNTSSLSLSMDPNISSKYEEIVKLVFAAKGAGILDGETMAQTITEAATDSNDIDEWLSTMRERLFQAPRPR